MITLLEAADANFVAHASWVASRLRGARVDARADLVAVDSGLPCDTFNMVCAARMAPDHAAARIAETLAFFADTGHPFSWWLGPADAPTDLGMRLEAAGLAPAEGELAMALDLANLGPASPAPAGLRIERVRTPEALAAFARINAANWSPPDPLVTRFYALAEPILLAADCPLHCYLGLLDGVPVATAECTIAGGVAGLYNIATLEPYRRRGIGSAMTRTPLGEARAEGIPTAVLQAAPDGVGVYARLGFAEVGRIVEYK